MEKLEKYEYDYGKLRGRIREKLKTEGAFATAIGRTPSYVSQVLNGMSQFTQTDIQRGVTALEIEPAFVGEYFFTLKGNKSETKEVTV